jgi:glycosyltransferase involved in cell wall biosynthesis
MIGGTLSLVLPAHNEEDNILPVLENALQVLPQFAEGVEILVVNDGSTDRTGERARSIAATNETVRVIDHLTNKGYGAALRSGISASTGDRVMVMDSDQQFDIGDIVYLAPLVESFDMVAGYRIHRNDPFHRTVFGKTFRLAMRLMFGVQLYDIDCAFKIMRGDLVRSLPLSADGALISTELMARWAKAGATWTQVGVHHYPRTAGQQSGGSSRVVLRAMRDVPLLWWRLKREVSTKTSGEQQDRKSLQQKSRTFLLLSGVATAVSLILVKVIRRKR